MHTVTKHRPIGRIPPADMTQFHQAAAASGQEFTCWALRKLKRAARHALRAKTPRTPAPAPGAAEAAAPPAGNPGQ